MRRHHLGPEGDQNGDQNHAVSVRFQAFGRLLKCGDVRYFSGVEVQYFVQLCDASGQRFCLHSLALGHFDLGR